MRKISFITMFLLNVSSMLFSQVAINFEGTPPDTSSMLDIQNDTKGVLFPRMALEQIMAINRPAKGLMAYSNTDNHIYINRGSKTSPYWAMVNSEWGASGSDIYFLGNNVGIGWQSPVVKLDIRSSQPFNPAALLLSNSDMSHKLLFSGGRQDANDSLPFIQWKQGDALRFGTDESGGVERMRITSIGQVGIGTPLPAANFHVTKTPFTYTGIFGTPISTWDLGTNVSIGDDNQSSVLYIGQNETCKGYMIWHRTIVPDDAFMSVGTYGDTNPLVLQEAGGNVGIRTTDPASLLEVFYNDNSYSWLGHTDICGNYFYHHELTDDGDGQSAIFGYRSREGDNPNPGTDYTESGSNTAIKGYSWFGDLYSFAITGFNFNDVTRCGGILGAYVTSTYWGSLGYKNSGATGYGGYFTSTTTGGGKSSQAAFTGIGMGAWGDLMGADIHGRVYGIYAEGGNYAIYANGTVYKNDLDVHLQKQSDERQTVLYTNVSTDVTVMTSGFGRLEQGRCNIEFDENFEKVVSEKVPVVVTVTPIGKSEGIYLTEISRKGFSVEEDGDIKSCTAFSYIAIGRRTGYENPNLSPEVIDAAYTRNLARGLHNDADTRTNGDGLYYENGQLFVGAHPSTSPDPRKTSESSALPKPTKHPKSAITNDDKGLTENDF